MNINDPDKLITDESVVNEVILNHPGGHAIRSVISNILVVKAVVSINLD